MAAIPLMGRAREQTSQRLLGGANGVKRVLMSWRSFTGCPSISTQACAANAGAVWTPMRISAGSRIRRSNHQTVSACGRQDAFIGRRRPTAEAICPRRWARSKAAGPAALGFVGGSARSRSLMVRCTSHVRSRSVQATRTKATWTAVNFSESGRAKNDLVEIDRKTGLG